MRTETELTLSPREMGMMLLSLFSVVVVLTMVFVDSDTETKTLLFKIDTGICVIFIINFFYGLWRAQDRVVYFKSHWIDLVASIPMIEQLRYARVFQVFRVIRLIKMSQSLLGPLLRQKREATLTSLLLALVTIISFASVMILLVEDGAPGSNINSAEAAIWWALVTISTVGYGDFYPVTASGRVIGAVVIVAGVSFFGVVAGFLASLFVKEEEAPDMSQLKTEQAAMKAQQQELLEEIRALRSQLEASTRSNQ